MKMNNKILALVLSTMLTIFSGTVKADGPPVSVNVGDVYYQLGGGEALPRPAAGFTSFNIRARFTAGFGYSCGKFNFHHNLEQMINQLMSNIRALPGQLQTAVSAAIAGLPGYLMQKYNPTLYNILTKTLDESAELFNLSFKTCEQMESEMAANPDANPYSGFLRASVADKWTVGSTTGDQIAADVHDEIKTDPADPIRWIGDDLYGTANRPIQINRDIVVAGYNILIGRTTDVSVTSAPPVPMRSEPIVQIWANPELAGRWIQEVIGEKRIVLDGSGTPPETIPGKGLRPQIVILEDAIRTALMDAYDNNEYRDLNTYSTVRISGSIIEGLRSMPAGERMIMMNKLISEMAVTEAQERMFLIKQMISVGINAPDVTSSTGGVVADDYIRSVTHKEIELRLNEIFADLELKQRTVNRTTISIINRAEQHRTSGAGSRPGAIRNENDYLNN